VAVKRPRNRIHGWIVIDKPLGMTSTQVVGKIRWLFNAEKAGHGGTLDPLATGLLPIALGEATKTVPYVMDGQKTYRFTVQWGSETSTDDLEGEVTAKSDYVATQQQAEEVQHKFIGAVQQIPPSYSAIKVSGERAYDLARAGETVELAARTVNIESIHIVSHEGSRTTFEVRCGKGTYVRSLARDMGREIGCLGHVVMLRRVAVGAFSEKDSISLEKLEEVSHRPPSENSLLSFLRPIETVLAGIPALAVMEPEATRLKQGQRVWLPEATALGETEAVLITHAAQPLGLFRIEHGVLKTIRMFNIHDARS
jgi:tRNA pseudouridine55 synthase